VAPDFFSDVVDLMQVNEALLWASSSSSSLAGPNLIFQLSPTAAPI
jgi:hypothetical protein